MRAFLYILRAWPDPDTCERGIPYAIDADEIFFGPCKRLLRGMLRREYLQSDSERDLRDKELYIVGLNATNPQKVRKIIWAGRISTIMTFAHAWSTLVGERYKEMRSDEYSPLHLEPLIEDGSHVGYRHASRQHEDALEWVKDLTGRDPKHVLLQPPEIRALPDTVISQAFERDACLLLERLFVATGAGIRVDAEFQEILRKAGFLRATDTLDEYAVFGHRADGSADGKAGQWLELTGSSARAFIERVQAEASLLPKGGALETPQRGSCDCRFNGKPPNMPSNC